VDWSPPRLVARALVLAQTLGEGVRDHCTRVLPPGPLRLLVGVVAEREIGLIISYNRFWCLTSITNHVD
jgi:hypothetical protein